jgi:hypothetical protein
LRSALIIIVKLCKTLHRAIAYCGRPGAQPPALFEVTGLLLLRMRLL